MSDESKLEALKTEETINPYEKKVRDVLSCIEALRAYALGESDAIPHTSLLTATTIEKLSTEKGRQFLKTWLRAFRGTFEIATEFIGEKDGRDNGQVLLALKDTIDALNQRI